VPGKKARSLSGYFCVTVPSGATSGTISVTDAGGTATTTKTFTVK